jgi:hypothetical protein
VATQVLDQRTRRWPCQPSPPSSHPVT